MKNERGLTLAALVITILLIIILASVAIQSGGGSITEIEFQNFSYELQQIQGRVDAIHEKMTMEKNSDYVSLNRINSRE